MSSQTDEKLRNLAFLKPDTWEDCINSDRVAVIFFMVGNNLDCKAQIPRIISFSQRYGDKFAIAVLDLGVIPAAKRVFDLDGVPTMAITRQGIVLGGRRGGLPEHEHEWPEFAVQLNQFQQMDMTAFLESNI